MAQTVLAVEITKLFPGGDFNYDGRVGPEDFNLLATRFGTTLADPAASQVTAAGRAAPHLPATRAAATPLSGRGINVDRARITARRR